jgi:hypothetical protein
MMFVTVMGFLVIAVATPSMAAPPKPPKEPAKIKVSVSPEAVSRGGQAEVTVVLRPIPPDAKESNYFDTVDPVQLELQVDASAPVGQHAIAGKLTYYYCVTASGFCAPARVPVKIPVEIR